MTMHLNKIFTYSFLFEHIKVYKTKTFNFFIQILKCIMFSGTPCMYFWLNNRDQLDKFVCCLAHEAFFSTTLCFSSHFLRATKAHAPKPRQHHC